jgi:hypothetical protein
VAAPGTTFNLRRVDFAPAALAGAAWGSVWELSRGGALAHTFMALRWTRE